MHALQVGPENKHLIGLQLRYPIRGEIRTLNSIVRSHIEHEVTKKTGTATDNLRLGDHVLMAVIAKSNGTFYQKHQGSHIQSNGNNNFKHSLIICCCKANACLCQDIAQVINPQSLSMHQEKALASLLNPEYAADYLVFRCRKIGFVSQVLIFAATWDTYRPHVLSGVAGKPIFEDLRLNVK